MNLLRFILLLLLLLSLPTAADVFTINPKAIDFGAKGDGVADDTAALQKAADRMAARGGHIRLTPGRYRHTRAILVNGDKDVEIYFEPGAVLVQDALADGSIDILCRGETNRRRVLRGVTIIGTISGDPRSVGTRFGIRSKGIPGDRTANGAHGLSIYDARIERVDGAAIELTHVYRANVFAPYLNHNGAGIRCDGANATTFYGATMLYNYVGAIDPQTMVGGCVEGSMSDGVQLAGISHRTNLHNVYFEQNALAGAGADIRNLTNSWMTLGIDGCFFASAYDKSQRPHWPAHNLKGRFSLVSGGNQRLFYGQPATGWAQFDIFGRVLDAGGGNALSDVPGGFGDRLATGEIIVHQPWATDLKLTALEKRLLEAERKLAALPP